MKLTPDDPKLSAYVLGELPPEEHQAVERAAASNPAIKLSIQELEKTCHWLSDTLNEAASQQLHPTQREAVRRASRDKLTSLDSARASHPSRRLRRAILPAAAAAVVIGSAVTLVSWLGPQGDRQPGTETAATTPTWPALPGPQNGTADTPTRSSNPEQSDPHPVATAGQAQTNKRSPDPSAAKKLPDPSHLPPTQNQSDFAATSSIRLPLVVGNQSYDWTRRWIRERNQRPPKHAVRVEELINAASLETTPWTDGLELGVAMADCPWNAESILIGIQLRADREEDQTDLILESQANTPRRVLGSFDNRRNTALPTTLPAGRANLIILEYRSKPEDLGKLVLHRGTHATSIDLRQRAQTDRPEMAHAVALAAFGRWLRDEIDDAALERAVTRAESQVTDSVRRDSLQLIRRAQSQS